MSTYGKYKRYVSPVDISRFVYKPSVIDYKKIVENDDVRKLQFTKFNNEVVPYTLLTTSLHHDNNLVTQPEFYRNQDNNLCIESVGSNINLFANDINKIHINGNVNFRNDTSFNSDLHIENASVYNLSLRDSLISYGNIVTSKYNLIDLFERINAIEMLYNGIVKAIEERLKEMFQKDYEFPDFNVDISMSIQPNLLPPYQHGMFKKDYEFPDFNVDISMSIQPNLLPPYQHGMLSSIIMIPQKQPIISLGLMFLNNE